MKHDREVLGRATYEAHRMSLNRTTDDDIPIWEWADHETQLAFRDAGETVAKLYEPAVNALAESSRLLAFLHGAFSERLKPEDIKRLTAAHAANRAVLSTTPTARNAQPSDSREERR